LAIYGYDVDGIHQSRIIIHKPSITTEISYSDNWNYNWKYCTAATRIKTYIFHY